MNEQAIRDLSRQYAGTVVQIFDKTDNQKHIVFVEAVQTLGGAPVMSFVSGDALLHKPLRDIAILDVPKSGVFEYNGISLVYRHRPERQWRRGICSENSSVTSPVDDLLQRMETNKVSYRFQVSYFSPQVLENLFNPVQRSFKEAIEYIASKKTVCACLDKHYYLSVFSEDDVFILWRMGKALAKINVASGVSSLFDPLYKQEVMDFFKRQGIYYAIR